MLSQLRMAAAPLSGVRTFYFIKLSAPTIHGSIPAPVQHEQGRSIGLRRSSILRRRLSVRRPRIVEQESVAVGRFGDTLRERFARAVAGIPFDTDQHRSIARLLHIGASQRI